MTEIQAGSFPAPIPPGDAPVADAAVVARSRPPRPYFRQVLGLAFGHTGAKIGLVWIVILSLAAIFAPFLASSHPLLLKTNGHWSSPVLIYLTPTDVVLQAAFWAFVVLWFPDRLLRTKALILLGVIVVTSAIAIVTVKPPAPIVYQQYRTLAKQGKIESAVYAPLRFSPDDHLRDQEGMRLAKPSAEHPMGTTSDSADLLSNMIHASRIAASIGFISTGIAVAIGIVIGGLMGFYSGWVDLIGMRLVEIFDAIPTLLLLLTFVAAFNATGPGALYGMMAIIGLTGWVGYATYVRAEFLSLRDRDFVQAAKAAGLPTWSILFRHMLPNGITPVLIGASFGVASAILIESTLSFLGIGLTNEASWGNLLNQSLSEGGTFYWWLALYPGFAIFLTVFGYNLIGEALRDALDPKLGGIK